MTINLNESIIAELRATHWKDNEKRQDLVKELVASLNKEFNNYSDDEQTLIKTLKLLSLPENYLALSSESLSVWIRDEIIHHLRNVDKDYIKHRIFTMLEHSDELYHELPYEVTRLLFESEILDGTYFYSRYYATRFVQRYLSDLIALFDHIYKNEDETRKPNLLSYDIESKITIVMVDVTTMILCEYIKINKHIDIDTFIPNVITWLSKKSEYDLDQLMGI